MARQPKRASSNSRNASAMIVPLARMTQLWLRYRIMRILLVEDEAEMARPSARSGAACRCSTCRRARSSLSLAARSASSVPVARLLSVHLRRELPDPATRARPVWPARNARRSRLSEHAVGRRSQADTATADEGHRGIACTGPKAFKARHSLTRYPLLK